MLNRVFLWLLLIMGYSTGLSAQEGHKQPDQEFEVTVNKSLTIADVVKATLSRSPENFVIKSKENNAVALTKRAESFFANTPEISLSHQNDRFGSDQGLREWESSLEMPLWLPGQKSASKQKARMSEKEAEAYQDLSLWYVWGQVRELLWQVKLAEAGLDESRNSLEMAMALDRDIARKISAGLLPQRDSLLSKKEVMSRRMEFITAQKEYIHAAKQYESVTGLNQMPEQIEEFSVPDDEALAAPVLVLADANVEFLQADYREKSKEWSVAPRLSLGVRREKSSYLDRNIDSVSLGLSVPLGGGVHMGPKRAEAALALAEAERQREIVKREHRLHLHEAEHELEVCKSQLPLTQSHLELAQENLRLSQKAFDLGEGNLLELLKVREQFFMSSSQNSLRNIECKRAIARHNQIKGVVVP
ncbi:TolC family protein [Paremcibacter congregatus]|uniref:TolC family protein n=1 Tax=Paremcibacter congregatus TaxID=2043170 RepID=A0A2G4YW04_9PROT|nr:TolC family protein [Paremcibacter congregatus]PHZ86505.1 hypothetical protein CRD36_01065 [Paremcibacter congregatus]QDE26308.1 hypothetical protein FIV45_02935 [Paremcibacter congregatus]